MLTTLANRLVAVLPLRLQNTARQFIKFGITGFIGAFVDFGTYNFLVRGLDWTASYEVFGQPILLANNISVFLAIISNFLLNKFWTFKDREGGVVGQWTSYFIMNVITWTLNQLLVSILTFNVPLMEELFGGQRDNMAKVFAIGVTLFLNFAGSKFIVFRKRPTETPAIQQQPPI
jgi:putative flippase GtrA